MANKGIYCPVLGIEKEDENNLKWWILFGVLLGVMLGGGLVKFHKQIVEKMGNLLKTDIKNLANNQVLKRNLTSEI